MIFYRLLSFFIIQTYRTFENFRFSPSAIVHDRSEHGSRAATLDSGRCLSPPTGVRGIRQWVARKDRKRSAKGYTYYRQIWNRAIRTWKAGGGLGRDLKNWRTIGTRSYEFRTKIVSGRGLKWHLDAKLLRKKSPIFFYLFTLTIQRDVNTRV